MTQPAHRLRQNGAVLYLMPYNDRGRRVLYRQDPATFETERVTVSPLRARRLARDGREVPLYETPAWCDPAAPRDGRALAQPT